MQMGYEQIGYDQMGQPIATMPFDGVNGTIMNPPTPTGVDFPQPIISQPKPVSVLKKTVR